MKQTAKSFRVLLLLAVWAGIASAAKPWTADEINARARTDPGVKAPAFDPDYAGQRNYLADIRQTCDFIARYQVADSLSPDFGGIIEAEHMPTTIETDNTQEAIWVWSRWYELTGRDDYRVYIDRAWRYVRAHPAFREGSGQNTWYAIWNCGLGFFAEMEYRRVYRDSAQMAYADTCRSYLFGHPLNFGSNQLHGNVTALAAGMMYRYALDRNDPVLRDSALAYGNRVRLWAEGRPDRLYTGNWAMSGGTVLWGICNSIWQADTTAGKEWLRVYADSVPYFMPYGTWNCSWNIWDANAFRAAGDITHDLRYYQYHQRLTDTLLNRDTDDDGGIPATWTDPETQDQTWVSTYLDFMGMDALLGPVAELDAGVLEVARVEPQRRYRPGDTLRLTAVVANFGRQTISFPVTARLPGREDTSLVSGLPFLAVDTIDFGSLPLTQPGLVPIAVVTDLAGDGNRRNDTVRAEVRVWPPRSVTGVLADSVSGHPVFARVEVRVAGDTELLAATVTDSFGAFRFTGIDTLLQIDVRPDLPFPGRAWQVAIRGDTALELWLNPAHLLLVNNDPASGYGQFYTATFDTLGLTCCVWPRRTAGPVPTRELHRLRDRLIVWFTGNAVTGTLDSTDMAGLTDFLDAGGRLFITGQNLGQELGATRFYQDRLHTRLVRPTVTNYLVFGNGSDPVGAQFTLAQTAGTQGANNQTSRDEISPDSMARAFLLYDTLSRAVCGIYHEDINTGSRLMYLGFGFEALNGPPARPSYLSRVTFFHRCHAWLTGTGGVEEPAKEPESQDALRVWPNPVRDHANFTIPASKQATTLAIYSVSGQLVRTLPARAAGSWDGTDESGRRVPAGAYLCRLAGSDSAVRVVLLQ